jgi:hypothetical protein
MAEFVFTSPGIKFRERDLTFVTRNVGITTLGVVGETTKGPAFEPVYVQDQTEFANRFGPQSVKRFPSNGQLQYQLPYTANAYLDESNQMWVTRVLGLSGYDAGNAWNITLSAGVDPHTMGVVSTSSAVTKTYAGNTYLGVTIYSSGQTGTSFSGFTKTGPTSFLGTSYSFTATTVNLTGGTVRQITTVLSGTSYSAYEGMVLAVIRSRGYVQDNVNLPSTTVFDCTGLTISASTNTTLIGSGDLFGQFTLKATNRGLKVPAVPAPNNYSGGTESYTASLNPDASSFLPNVIGNLPKDKKTKIWCQATYPQLIKKLDADGTSVLITDPVLSGLTKYGISGVQSYAYGIHTDMIRTNTTLFGDYKTQFKTPETPWVVSQLKGNNVARLFKFISISDGDAANQEIKISIGNINPITMEFDVLVRAFYDTDAAPNVLETYTRCTLIKGTNAYIAQRIGTTDGEYDLQSKYIMVEMDSEEHQDSFPAGFEGLWFNDYALSATTTGSVPTNYAGITPKVFYKTHYESNERVARVYLGMSASGYDAPGVVGDGINQNFFNFDGYNNVNANPIGYTKTKGFHMDINATGATYMDGAELIGSFEVGAGSFESIADVVDPLNPYYLLASRKFTLAPAGGFDGWDVNRNSRSYGDFYRQGGIYDGVQPLVPATNDFQAWETAINTFSNPEQVTINVFATPGINWSDQNVLVLDTINMLTTQRTDTLYVIDTPDIEIPKTTGSEKQDVLAAQGIVDLLDTSGIDSNYSCTYFPWIQMRDTQNNVNVYIPPTGEVVKAMAYTDNTAFPWFAPAGLNRGVTNARKSMYKLSLEARDILYTGRINPMADFADAGTAIFGQKTLQVKASALDRINVRRLLLQLKVLITNIAIRLVFEQNDQTTIDQFLSKATPVLDTVKRERGLYDFRIKMDDIINTPETIDRNELFGEIFIKPTRAVEYIGITFTITPTGASFADVGA